MLICGILGGPDGQGAWGHHAGEGALQRDRLWVGGWHACSVGAEPRPLRLCARGSGRHPARMSARWLRARLPLLFASPPPPDVGVPRQTGASLRPRKRVASRDGGGKESPRGPGQRPADATAGLTGALPPVCAGRTGRGWGPHVHPAAAVRGRGACVLLSALVPHALQTLAARSRRGCCRDPPAELRVTPTSSLHDNAPARRPPPPRAMRDPAGPAPPLPQRGLWPAAELRGHGGRDVGPATLSPATRESGALLTRPPFPLLRRSPAGPAGRSRGTRVCAGKGPQPPATRRRPCARDGLCPTACRAAAPSGLWPSPHGLVKYISELK